MSFFDGINASIDAHFKEVDAFQSSKPSKKADDDEGKVAAAAVKQEAKSGQEKPPVDDPRAELRSICQTMGSSFLHKLVVSRLSDLAWLRREVPAALRGAPDPAKLVFDSIGRFYLQDRKAYENRSTVIDSRRASILILEFYILSGLPRRPIPLSRTTPGWPPSPGGPGSKEKVASSSRALWMLWASFFLWVLSVSHQILGAR